MSSPGRDADLLMLVHRELDRVQTLGVRLHLALCPACRVRLRRFEALSGALATAYRNPVLGVRTLGGPPTRVWASFGLLAILLTMLGWVVASNAAASAPASGLDPKDMCPPHTKPAAVPVVHACEVPRVKK